MISEGERWREERDGGAEEVESVTLEQIIGMWKR